VNDLIPLLATKVTLPLLRRPFVSRQDLLRRLSAGLAENHLLTFISAPAGYGKTTTLRLWLEELNRPVAWIRLEKSDNHLPQFLKYLLAALQHTVDHLGQTASEAIESPRELNLPQLLGLLINDLNALEQPIILVLEDYHLIENPEIAGIIESLLYQTIQNLHLVITTREDPDLSLARLRAKNQLTEIRAADLRFSLDEAGEFLTKVMSIHLSEKQIAILEQRTEGWIAGLQLAALSLKESHSPEAFIHAFRGTHRHVLDYLLEEVLQGQIEEVRNFLRQTSILEQLSPSLCEAVTGQKNSHQLLRYLERNNLFLVPQDDHRVWYRYHALFAELLKNQLLQTEPDCWDELHRRAAHWYVENGYIHKAIEHAFQIADRALVLQLIEAHSFPMFFQGEVTTVIAWFDRLPESYLHTSPMLCISKAWALVLMQRRTRGIEVSRMLQQAKEALDQIGADEALRNLVAGHTATIQAFLIQTQVLLDEAPDQLIAISQRAQRLLPKEERAIRCVNSLNIGYGYLALADLPASRVAFAQTLEDGLAGGNLYAAVYGPINLILIAMLEGQNGEAWQLCETHIQQFNKLLGSRRFPPIGALYIQKSNLLLEQDRLVEAEQLLLQGMELVRWTGEYETHMKGYTAQARLYALRHDWSGMLNCVKTLEEIWPEGALYAQALGHRLSLHYRVDSKAGIEEAMSWLAQVGVAFNNLPPIRGVDPISETYFQTHLCVGHILARLAPRKTSPSSYGGIHHEFERRQQFARDHGFVRWSVDLAIVRARLHQAAGEMDEARALIQTGLALAAPNGFFRVFVNEGAPMLALLRGVQPYLASLSLTAYTERLIEAIQRESTSPLTVDTNSGERLLSERELEVVRCLADGLTYPAIANRLIISVNTVRYHIKAIYSKLHISSRAAAIAWAREQKLL
jgi:LuxR family transcriptional regulator, maltose regulon positive regulatory protein